MLTPAVKNANPTSIFRITALPGLGAPVSAIFFITLPLRLVWDVELVGRLFSKTKLLRRITLVALDLVLLSSRLLLRVLDPLSVSCPGRNGSSELKLGPWLITEH